VALLFPVVLKRNSHVGVNNCLIFLPPIKIRTAFARNACGPSFRKTLARLIHNRKTPAQSKIPAFKNDSGCKALRVDGRNCVPYNNLSLQPETRLAAPMCAAKLRISGEQSSRQKDCTHNQMNAVIDFAKHQRPDMQFSHGQSKYSE
jgi:hypothetical protein